MVIGHGRRQERFEFLFHGDWAGTGSAATVRGRESLVQIQVHDVDAEVAGTDFADQRVHVGAVHVEQAAFGVHDLGDLVDLLLEDAQRVGICEHQCRDIFIHLRSERGHIHHALSIGFQIFHCVADHRRSRRVGPVGGIWNQNFLARAAFRFVIGANHQQSREFAVCAGGGLQGDGVHAGDFGQAFAQSLDDAQRALRNTFRLVGMSVGQALEAHHQFVHARVVLHGARTQGIHSQIDGVVPGGDPGEVADDFDLAHFGHVAQIFSFGRSQERGGVHLGNIERRQFPCCFPCG